LAVEREGQAKPMASTFLIACGIVAAVILLLITASMFGVSRRALETEIRQAEGHAEESGEHRRERGDADIAA
jgi:ABC-type lipoprotein release transport system permease subunit